MVKLQLKLLGSFRIEADGEENFGELLERSPRGLLLLQYLLVSHGQRVSAETLTKVMWPKQDSAHPESALKTLISRLRTMMKQISPALEACLLTTRGGYRWETQPGVTVDLEEFEQLAHRLSGHMDEREETWASFQRMLELYTGPLLSDQEVQPWLLERRDELYQSYLAVLDEAMTLLESKGRYDTALSICREAMDAAPGSGALHLRLLRQLTHAGRDSEAVKQLQLSTAIVRSQPQLENANTLLDTYYRQLMQVNRDIHQSVHALRRDLLDSGANTGALICDQAVFRTIFEIERRSMERTGTMFLLGIAMLTGLEESPLQLDTTMQGLMNLLVQKLRRGDTITRLNATQLGLLLTNANDSAASTIIERLKRCFYERFPAVDCTLSIAIIPLNIANADAASQQE